MERTLSTPQPLRETSLLFPVEGLSSTRKAETPPPLSRHWGPASDHDINASIACCEQEADIYHTMLTDRPGKPADLQREVDETKATIAKLEKDLRVMSTALGWLPNRITRFTSLGQLQEARALLQEFQQKLTEEQQKDVTLQDQIHLVKSTAASLKEARARGEPVFQLTIEEMTRSQAKNEIARVQDGAIDKTLASMARAGEKLRIVIDDINRELLAQPNTAANAEARELLLDAVKSLQESQSTLEKNRASLATLKDDLPRERAAVASLPDGRERDQRKLDLMMHSIESYGLVSGQAADTGDTELSVMLSLWNRLNSAVDAIDAGKQSEIKLLAIGSQKSFLEAFLATRGSYG